MEIFEGIGKKKQLRVIIVYRASRSLHSQAFFILQITDWNTAAICGLKPENTPSS